MSAYLDPHAVLVGALAFGVWTLIALVVGALLGAVIHQADVVEGTTDDQHNGDLADTREITIPREWMTRSTFEAQL